MTCKYRVTKELWNPMGSPRSGGLYCNLLEGRISPGMCENCRHNPKDVVPRSQARLFPVIK